MPTWAWVLIVVGAVALVALLAAVAFVRRRTMRLQQRFGREYDRALEKEGSKRRAEAELSTRIERREQINVRPLSPESRERFRASWTDVQKQFVDDPGAAVMRADQLVSTVMNERGYPMDDFDGRAADISVDHPDVVERFRSAHGIAKKNERGRATTEDLRQAIKHYRALFEELLETTEDEPLSRDDAAANGRTTDERAVRR
jgi:hypothetical protein